MYVFKCNALSPLQSHLDLNKKKYITFPFTDPKDSLIVMIMILHGEFIFNF